MVLVTTLKAAASWVLPFAVMLTVGPILVVGTAGLALWLGPAAPLAFLFGLGLLGLAACSLASWLGRTTAPILARDGSLSPTWRNFFRNLSKPSSRASDADGEAVAWIRDAARRVTGGHCAFVDDDLRILEHLAGKAVSAGLTDGLSEDLRAKIATHASTRTWSEA